MIETFVISLYGEFDLAAVQALPAWTSTVDGEPHVEVDLTGLTFMDSCALREIVKLGSLLESQGRDLALRVIPGSIVERVFEITGLMPRFTFISG